MTFLRAAQVAMLRAAQDWLKTDVGLSQFNMRYYHIHNVEEGAPRYPGQCGTAMCIAGYLRDAYRVEYHNNHMGAVCDKLFIPNVMGRLSELTPEQAIRAIDQFIETDGLEAWEGIIPLIEDYEE